MTSLTAVTAMLPLVTPYSMPTDSTQAQTLYDLAGAKISTDGFPTDNDTVLTQAYCYLIAGTLSVKDGSGNMTSEHLGNWSATYATSNTASSRWITAYETLLSSLIGGSLLIHDPIEISDVETSCMYPMDGVSYDC